MLVCILPLQAFVMYYDITLALPWHGYSWSEIHGQAWFKVIKVPVGNQVFFDRWTSIASGFMIFIFFGFGHDATRMYNNIFWYLGLGHCFPSIQPPVGTQNSASRPHTDSASTIVDTISTRAKSLFTRKNSNAFLTRASYNDIEKGIPSTCRSSPLSRWSWLSSIFGRRSASHPADDGTPLQDLSGASNTVLTNAWASPCRSNTESLSPVSPMQNKDFIHVQHIISQQNQPQARF